MIDTALDAARGELDLSKARQVTYQGRAAYEVPIRAATARPAIATPRRSRSRSGSTAQSNAPFAVRWGEGADHWRSADIQAFEQLPDDAAHQPLLNFG